MLVGIVKRVRDDYGFIEAEGEDYFYHVADFAREGLAPPRVNDRIEFSPSSGPKGKRVGGNLRFQDSEEF
jgi:cold shock CspA family protein